MSISAVMIGDSTLLVRCGEHFLRTGHRLAGVATRNTQVRAWCEAHGVACEDRDGVDPAGLFANVDCDYLFSVANLELLPGALLGKPKRLALNFHDGPLPAMAGLNVPVWALLDAGGDAPAQEDRPRTHGVTWHEMTDTPDGGRIAVTETFEIAPDETAFSLNAKCYEAGLTAFSEMLALIAADRLLLVPQSGARHVFTRARRPDRSALIDPEENAEAIAQLVRALDHGRYWNPLALAKVWTDEGCFTLRSATPAGEVADGTLAGTVIERDGDAIVIATGRGALRLGGLRALGPANPSSPTPALPRRGHRVRRPDTSSGQTLADLTSKAGAEEARWLKLLRSANGDAELPYPRITTRSDDRRSATANPIVRLDIDLTPSRGLADAGDTGGPSGLAEVLSAATLWLNRLGVDEGALVSVRSPETVAAVAGWGSVFSPVRPLIVALDDGAQIGSHVEAMRSRLASLFEAGPLARDLEQRLLGVEAPLAGMPRALMAVCSDGASADVCLEAADLALRLDPITGALTLTGDGSIWLPQTIAAMACHIAHVFKQVTQREDLPVRDLSLVPSDETALFDAINAETYRPVRPVTLDVAFSEQAARTPDAIALKWHGETVTYADLDRRVTALAQHLAGLGAGRGTLVAVSLERTPAVVVGLLAILRSGAAYVPVDPKFPDDRIAFIRSDSAAGLLVTDQPSQAGPGVVVVAMSGAAEVSRAASASDSEPALGNAVPPPGRDLADLAYLTYTSGSTGKPKGVRVTHANVANFLAGMDDRIPERDGGTWLSVTSISFDISVLEIFWTLTRGFTIALHSDVPDPSLAKGPSFSLFYFAAAQGSGADARRDSPASNPYRLLMEGARFADAHGFEAIWTPERHFHDFGGLYPNPAVTGAAVAAVTSSIKIRAGSCVLPLHDALRVAEDWSLVDALSGGRAGVAFAAGWMPEDFVLNPGAYDNRRARMLEQIEEIEKLWRGDRVERAKPGGGTAQVSTLPRPIQARLPIWLTAAKTAGTFEIAGRRGWNVLTHLLGMSLDEVAANIALYRAAWTKAGHAGQGRVTLMLHSFVGADGAQVRETVRAPMKRYLASAIDIVKAADWQFPTNVKPTASDPAAVATGAQKTPDLSGVALAPDEVDAILDHAFNRYYETSGLFGTPETCAAFAAKLHGLGVDELACLIDFGVDSDAVLASLPLLAEVMQNAGGDAGRVPLSAAGDIVRHGATHLQCTPSMAGMLLADEEGRRALGGLKAMLVGGEALPATLARDLARTVGGPVVNMYGPTETTVWSTCGAVSETDAFVALGRPIANTVLDVVDGKLRSCPALVAGELLIGGAGVADGYWKRPELTADRFITRRAAHGLERFYRTGDLVRRHTDGSLEFLGRIDNQVKLRGHRIELGEIEAALADCDDVAAAVVVSRNSGAAMELAAFVAPLPGRTPDVAALRQRLAERLPAIMVPASIAVVAQMPMTANGKIDRRALADRPAKAAAETSLRTAPAAGGQDTRAPGSPPQRPNALAGAGDRAQLEATVAALWCQVLGTSHVERGQNFFDLGGHSLLAVELHRTLRGALDVDLALTDIFRFPTVASLSQHLAAKTASKNELQPQAVSHVANEGLNRAQMRLAMSRRGRGGPGAGQETTQTRSKLIGE